MKFASLVWSGLALLAVTLAVPSAVVGQQLASDEPVEAKDCRQNNPPDQVIESCTAALKLNIKDLYRNRYLTARAFAFMRKARFEEALSDYDAAAAATSDVGQKFSVLTSRANVLAVMDRADEAKKQLDGIIEERRKGSDKSAIAFAIVSRANLDLNLGEYSEALNRFREAESIHSSESAMVGIAAANRYLGSPDIAIAILTTVIEKQESPSFTKGIYLAQRGETLRLMGNMDGALSDLNKAVELNDLNFIRNFRSRLYRQIGEMDKSLADLDSAMLKTPDSPVLFVERGVTFEKMGDTEKAIASYKKALTETFYGSLLSKRESTAWATTRLAAIARGEPLRDVPFTPQWAKSKAGVATVAPTVATPQPAVPSPVAARPVTKENRVALIIGNSRYKSVSALPNPASDAAAVANGFRAIGFTSVNVVSDASRETLVNEFRKFSELAERADWAVVYYAGHGIEIGGVNYLVPVDAKLASDRDVQFEAVSLDQVLSSVEGAKKLKLVVLDACRDNPFIAQMRRTTATRSIGRGLGRIEPEGATLVVYAAKHGQTALDGTGGNSPFASALVKRLNSPDVEILKTFRLVRDDVMEATSNRQEPFTYGSLPGREDFFFVRK